MTDVTAANDDDETTGVLGPTTEVAIFVSEELIRVGRDATLRQLAHRLAAEGVGALVVVDEDHVHGVVSERDVVHAIAAGKSLDGTRAGDLDSRHLITCTPDTSVQTAAQLMVEHYVRHLLVEDESGPIGMISARDLLGAYAT